MIDILQIDQNLFQFIHYTMKNELFDLIMPFLRNKNTWLPLYLLIIGYHFYSYSIKKGTIIILGLILTVGITDFVSSQLIKKTVERPRPCHSLSGLEVNSELVKCGSGFSFPSSHAANHFAIASFLIFLGSVKIRGVKWMLLLWASVISFAQIYVGLHYPSDVLAGALLGSHLALIVSLIVRKWIDQNKFSSHV